MKARKHVLITPLVISALILLSISVSCVPQDETMKPLEELTEQVPAAASPDISRLGTVRLTNGEWPPYLSEHLEHYGVASRIVTEAFALEEIKVEYGFFPWKRAYEMAKSGEWDGSVVWLHTPEREKYFHFSEPVTQVEYVFWHLKSFDFDWNTIDDLQNVTIGGIRGYFYEDIFSGLEKAGKAKVEWVSSDEQNFLKLLAGRIDLYIQDVNVGSSMLQDIFTPEERELLTYHSLPLRVDDMCLILSRQVAKNERLLTLFNQGLQRLHESGKIEKYLAEINVKQ